jgi:hypothetical protein
MRPVPSILGALRRVSRRNLWTFGSVKLNNFFLFVALLIYGAAVSHVAPIGAYPFLLLLGVLLLFPLSGDPMEKIPPGRLGLWPLTRRQRTLLRIASLIFSPVLWLVAILSLRLGTSSALLAVPMVLRRQLQFNLRIPGMGVRPILLRANLRQLFSVLDTWLAIAISAAGCGYRLLSQHPDPAAFPILAMLVALAMSTYAQCLFGLDSESGMTRYGLLPIRGWQILAVKDAACLGILLILTLPLHPGAGMVFGLTSIAAARYPALRAGIAADRWRFTSGRILFGGLQIVLGAAAGFSASQTWPLVIAAYTISLHWGGRRLIA